MRYVAVGIYRCCGATLAAVADSATEFLKRMLLVERMIGQRVRIAAVAGIVDCEVARGASIYPIQFRQENLPHLDRNLLCDRSLSGVSGPTELLLNELVLITLPLSIFISDITKHNEASDQET
jgi:hypothetical protein